MGAGLQACLNAGWQSCSLGAQAEDIVFLADLDRFESHEPGSEGNAAQEDEEATIDLVEFHRLVVGWA